VAASAAFEGVVVESAGPEVSLLASLPAEGVFALGFGLFSESAVAWGFWDGSLVGFFLFFFFAAPALLWSCEFDFGAAPINPPLGSNKTVAVKATRQLFLTLEVNVCRWLRVGPGIASRN
jgi:hypothetical protein